MGINPAKSLLILTVSGLLLASCSGNSAEDERDIAAEIDGVTVIQPGAPGEPNRTLDAEDIAAFEEPTHNDADVAFVQAMLEHHAQALVMTGYVAERTDDPEITLLAERMEVSQADETELMEAWLQDRGELARDPDSAHGGGHATPAHSGMLTQEEIDGLEATSGSEFDEMFLTLMIKHHQGAVAMVTGLYEDGGGRETDIDTIARHIEADQNIEIGRMEEMLADRTS